MRACCLIHFLTNDYFNEPVLDQFNRTLFAIAAYNAGPAKIARCRDLATNIGYDRNTWFGNVEVATAKVAGRQTAQYVANIYKYYLAYRMAQTRASERDRPSRKGMVASGRDEIDRVFQSTRDPSCSCSGDRLTPVF
jgi:hypothetical protein